MALFNEASAKYCMKVFFFFLESKRWIMEELISQLETVTHVPASQKSLKIINKEISLNL